MNQMLSLSDFNYGSLFGSSDSTFYKAFIQAQAKYPALYALLESRTDSTYNSDPYLKLLNKTMQKIRSNMTLHP